MRKGVFDLRRVCNIGADGDVNMGGVRDTVIAVAQAYGALEQGNRDFR